MLEPRTTKEMFEVFLPFLLDKYKPKLIDHACIIGWQIKNAGDWTMDLIEGTIRPGCNAEKCDLTVITTAEAFERIMQDYTAAALLYSINQIRLVGDLAVAQKLHKFFDLTRPL